MNRIRPLSPIRPIRFGVGRAFRDRNELHDLVALGLKTETELHPDFVADILAHQPPTFTKNDSQTLSQIVRTEKRRAAFLALSILFLLIAALIIAALNFFFL